MIPQKNKRRSLFSNNNICTVFLAITTLMTVITNAATTEKTVKTQNKNITIATRTFQYIDKNNDSIIDQKEFQQLPQSMQSWLRTHHQKESTPLSKISFLSIYPQMITALRRQTTPTAPQKTPLYATGTPPENLETAAKTSSSEQNDIPTEYQPADLNHDGQIDFHEWRQFKRDNLTAFFQLDKNNDTILSVVELGGTVTIKKKQKPSSQSATTTATNNAKIDPKINVYFNYMDQNKNQKIDPNEWSASRRIRPRFEKAGIDLKKPMSKEHFALYYNKIFNASYYSQNKDSQKSWDKKKEKKDEKKKDKYKDKWSKKRPSQQ